VPASARSKGAEHGPLTGSTVDAAGGFGRIDAKAMGKVFAGH